MNSKIALVLAIILGAFAAITVKFYIKGIEKQAENKSMLRSILIAKTSLKANQLISANDLDYMPIPNEYYDQRNMLSSEDSKAIIGQQIYHEVDKGKALMKSHFEASGSSDTNSLLDLAPSPSARLKPFERAVTLKVDGLTGVAMLLKAGDYIDIYWTGQTSPEISNFLGLKVDLNQSLEKVTTLVLSDVFIMALDNRYNSIPTVAKNRIQAVKENYGSITVKCRSNEEAKMLIHAQTVGKLTMVKKGDDQNIVDNDEALDLLQMLKSSRKVNAIRRKDKGN